MAFEGEGEHRWPFGFDLGCNGNDDLAFGIDIKDAAVDRRCLVLHLVKDPKLITEIWCTLDREAANSNKAGLLCIAPDDLARDVPHVVHIAGRPRRLDEVRRRAFKSGELLLRGERP